MNNLAYGLFCGLILLMVAAMFYVMAVNTYLIGAIIFKGVFGL